ncbi:hypothetical protein Efla_000775 [Eimeria flavescens]
MKAKPATEASESISFSPHPLTSSETHGAVIGETAQNSPPVSGALPVLRPQAAQRKLCHARAAFAVALSALAAVSFLIACCRPALSEVGDGSVGRRLASSLPYDDEDAEQSSILDSCLHLQADLGYNGEPVSKLPEKEKAIFEILSSLYQDTRDLELGLAPASVSGLLPLSPPNQQPQAITDFQSGPAVKDAELSKGSARAQQKFSGAAGNQYPHESSRSLGAGPLLANIDATQSQSHGAESLHGIKGGSSFWLQQRGRGDSLGLVTSVPAAAELGLPISDWGLDVDKGDPSFFHAFSSRAFASVHEEERTWAPIMSGCKRSMEQSEHSQLELPPKRKVNMEAMAKLKGFRADYAGANAASQQTNNESFVPQSRVAPSNSATAHAELTKSDVVRTPSQAPTREMSEEISALSFAQHQVHVDPNPFGSSSGLASFANANLAALDWSQRGSSLRKLLQPNFFDISSQGSKMSELHDQTNGRSSDLLRELLHGCHQNGGLSLRDRQSVSGAQQPDGGILLSESAVQHGGSSVAVTSFAAAPPRGSLEPQSLTSGRTSEGPAPTMLADRVSSRGSFVTVTLLSGALIKIPHPTPEVSPCTHPYFRLPSVHPDAIQTEFSAESAFSHYRCKCVSSRLHRLREVLLERVLTKRDVDVVVRTAELIVNYLAGTQRRPLGGQSPTRATEMLGLRFLCFDVLVSLVQLLGPAMNPQTWFPQLVEMIPTEYRPPSRGLLASCQHSRKLSERLSAALTNLKQGQRASMEETIQLKRSLFRSPQLSRGFGTDRWEAWRADDDNHKIVWGRFTASASHLNAEKSCHECSPTLVCLHSTFLLLHAAVM